MDLLKVRSMLSQRKTIYDMSLKVAYYARVSTEMDEQLNSLNNQISFFETEIENQPNWTFVKGYVDEGISGAQVSKRVNFLTILI